MKDIVTHFLSWYWRKRSGVLLFRRVRGGRRIPFEVTLLLLGGYAWHLYLSSLPTIGSNWIVSMVLSPFGVVGILCTTAHEIGISYLRDQIPGEVGFLARSKLCVPGRVLAIYRKLNGDDLAIKVLGRIRIAAFGSFAVGFIVYNWNRVFH